MPQSDKRCKGEVYSSSQMHTPLLLHLRLECTHNVLFCFPEVIFSPSCPSGAAVLNRVFVEVGEEQPRVGESCRMR